MSRRRAPLFVGATLTICAVMNIGGGRATTASSLPEWSIPGASDLASLGTQVDRIAVVVCRVPLDTTNPSLAPLLRYHKSVTVDGARVTSWANTKVTPWFDAASGGRYKPVFVAAGEVALSREEGADACRTKAGRQLDDSFTSLMAVPDIGYGGGDGTPGSLRMSTVNGVTTRSLVAATSPARVSGRSLVVYAGGVLKGIFVVVHELGHTLGWPHYFSGPASEYDSPFDVMSGRSLDFCGEMCAAQNTLAVNRLASGWIDPQAVVTFRSGVSRVEIVPPTTPAGEAGAPIVMVPAGTPEAFYTLEARRTVGPDGTLPKAGVLVSFVDGTDCDEPPCWATDRRQRPAGGEPGSRASMLAPGEHLTLGAITVRNEASTATGFSVLITDTAVPPATPTDPLAAYWASGTIRVSWTAPNDDGGSPLLGYVVAGADGLALCRTTDQSCVVPTSTAPMTVRAINALGESSPVTVRFDPANKPALRASPGSASVLLSWRASASAVRYLVTDQRGARRCATTRTYCRVRKLDPSVRHTFILRVLGPSGRTQVTARATQKPYLDSKNSFVSLLAITSGRRVGNLRVLSRCGVIAKGFVQLGPTSRRCTVVFRAAGRTRRVELRQ